MATQEQADALSRGIAAGIRRVQFYQLEAASESINSGIAAARRLLDNPEVEASDRFVELFGELLAVAVSARFTYGEAPLADSDIEDYLLQSFTFLNSFRHV
jgi:hypothetical protein